MLFNNHKCLGKCRLAFLVLWLPLTGCDKLPAPPSPEPQNRPTTSPLAEEAPPALPSPELPPQPAMKSSAELVAEFQSLKPFEVEDRHLEMIAKLEQPELITGKLDLSQSKVSDNGMALLSQFPELEAIDLSRSMVRGNKLQMLSQLEHLEALSLDATRFDSGNSSKFSEFSKLKRLSLRETGISDSVYQSISDLPLLEELSLDGNKNLLGRNFADLVANGKFQHLRVLSVGDSQFGYYGLLSIDHLQNLQSLNARNSGLNLKSMVPISKCRYLKALILSDNPLSDESLTPLKGLKELELLELERCPGVSDAALVTLKTMKQLKRLVLTGTSLTPNGKDALRKALSQTEIVDAAKF